MYTVYGIEGVILQMRLA